LSPVAGREIVALDRYLSDSFAVKLLPGLVKDEDLRIVRGIASRHGAALQLRVVVEQDDAADQCLRGAELMEEEARAREMLLVQLEVVSVGYVATQANQAQAGELLLPGEQPDEVAEYGRNGLVDGNPFAVQPSGQDIDASLADIARIERRAIQ